MRGGSSSTILYAVRLVTRVEAFVNYLLSQQADAVRGLALPGTPDFGGDSPAKTKLRKSSMALRRKLIDHALPVLQGWYARLRRDAFTKDACTVAAHMAFIHADSPEFDAEHAAAAGTAGGVDAKHCFMLLSTRVYLNVHHDFELEPELMLQSAKGRKRTVAATAHTSTTSCELGYAPLEIFDLWQRKLHDTLAFLGGDVEQASDVMEATVRLLSNRETSATQLSNRAWASMHGLGCEGRYTPSAKEKTPSAAVGRAGWGSEQDAEADAAARSGGYPAWLRVKVSAAAETEINVQLGELTLKRHHMQLLEMAVAKHEDFIAVFGDGVEGVGRHQCAEVKRSTRRRWLRLLGTRQDVQIWAPDDRAPPPPRTAHISGALSPWVQVRNLPRRSWAFSHPRHVWAFSHLLPPSPTFSHLLPPPPTFSHLLPPPLTSSHVLSRPLASPPLVSLDLLSPPLSFSRSLTFSRPPFHRVCRRRSIPSRTPSQSSPTPTS